MRSPSTEGPTESEIPLRISMNEIAIIANDLVAPSKPPLGGASPQRGSGFRVAAETEVMECGLFRHSGKGLGGSDIDAGQRVLPQEADCCDSVKGNRYPHTGQWGELQCNVNVLEPKRGAFGGYSFNSADAESARVYPNLPAQKVFVF